MINGYVKKGHGIDVYLMNEIKNITRGYFHQPLAEKNKIKLSAETGYKEHQKIGENITKGILDIPEAIDCYREVKHGMYGDLGAVMQGSNKCDVLASCVTHLFAWNQLNLSGAHTHYGLLTLVNQDDDIVVLQVSSVLDHEDLIYREVPRWSEYLVDFGGLLVNFINDGGCRTVLEACSFPSRVSDTGASFRFHTRTSSNLNDNLPVNSILEIDFYGRLDFQNQN
ncbi:hypothetical protein T459_19494 [Capsicum annuum]|uniref:Non-haem dioxygenase N-terminal domain-containing protein n=1 Tax=Capsicum annuum TaxID=4072 RepID=A0A2G2Z1S3_CAPAN|nr:hypothetical protein T459_19494 [Capsicum annuum]